MRILLRFERQSVLLNAINYEQIGRNLVSIKMKSVDIFPINFL